MSTYRYTARRVFLPSDGGAPSPYDVTGTVQAANICEAAREIASRQGCGTEILAVSKLSVDNYGTGN